MKISCFGLIVVGAFLTATTTVAYANDAKEEDARKLSVVNGSDGTWRLLSEGKEISKGTSTIDPTKKPKSLDFTTTEGEEKGKPYLGVYELGEKTRKMCFALALPRRRTTFVI
jgi:uncharacterized protein (TIGR03067 family)